jgi:hypothetical protein
MRGLTDEFRQGMAPHLVFRRVLASYVTAPFKDGLWPATCLTGAGVSHPGHPFSQAFPIG